MYSDGKGDYTKEKYENLEELTIEDFEKFYFIKDEFFDLFKDYGLMVNK